MAKKTAKDDLEFREIIKELNESAITLLEEGRNVEGEFGYITFSMSEDRATVFLDGSDGSRAAVPLSEFQEIVRHDSEQCLLCPGKVGMVFDTGAPPPVKLQCEKCGATHLTIEGKLYILQD